MGIELGSNFDVKTNLPLDSRLKVADQTARDAIDALVRYEGMTVFVTSEGKNYQLVGGVTNADWQELASGSGSGTGSKNYSGAYNGSTIDAISGDTGLTAAITTTAGEYLANADDPLTIKFSKDAANRNGSKWTITGKTLDDIDDGRTLYGSFGFRTDYSANYAGEYVKHYAVDQSGAVCSSVQYLPVGQVDKIYFTVFPRSTSTRIDQVFEVESTDTTAWDFSIDENIFGPKDNVAFRDNVAIGIIQPYAGTVEPEGFLFCDGRAISRSQYSALFAAIGTAYGIGDGSTTFNIPDLRGQFIRGTDDMGSDEGAAGVDPDAASRINTKSGNTGNNVGSEQGDEFRSHRHGRIYSNGAGGSGAYHAPGNGTTTGTAQTNYTGGNETRPKNVYTNFIIKAESVSGNTMTENEIASKSAFLYSFRSSQSLSSGVNTLDLNVSKNIGFSITGDEVTFLRAGKFTIKASGEVLNVSSGGDAMIRLMLDEGTGFNEIIRDKRYSNNSSHDPTPSINKTKIFNKGDVIKLEGVVSGSFTISNTSISIIQEIDFEGMGVIRDGQQWLMPVVEDSQSFTPALHGQSNGQPIGNTTNTGRYSRVGATGHFNITTIFNGAPSGGTGYFVWGLPDGLTINESQLPNINRFRVNVGSLTILDNGTSTRIGTVNYDTNSKKLVGILENGGDSITATIPITFTTNDSIALSFTVPILEWENSNNIIGEYKKDIKTAKIEAAGNAGTALTANTTNIDFTQVEDLMNVWDGTTVGPFPIKTKVNFEASVYSSTNVQPEFAIYKGSTKGRTVYVASASQRQHIFSGKVKLEANETFTIRSNTAFTLSDDSNRHYIDVSAEPDFKLYGVNSYTRTYLQAKESLINHPFSAGVYGDLASFELQPGIYNCSAIAVVGSNTSSGWDHVLAVTTTAGDNTTGIQRGYNQLLDTKAGNEQSTLSLEMKNIVVSTPTTYYLKSWLSSKGGTPRVSYNFVFEKIGE